VIWFGANGTGKTAGIVGRLVDVFEGTDPLCAEARRPLRILLIVTGYDAVSARDFADQLHALCPKGLVAQQDVDDGGELIGKPRPWYTPGKGFRGRPPRLIVTRGPMKGAVLNVSTLGSGAGAAAGGSLDLILVNEPIDKELFDELSSRDRAEALGYLWYGFTPTIKAPDQTWIPGVVARTLETGGSIRFIQTKLTPEALTFPSGRTLESWPKTAARIAKWSSISRPMRMGESLEPILDDAFFSAVFSADCLKDDVAGFVGSYTVGSLDWSTTDGRTRFLLTGWLPRSTPVRHLEGVIVLDLRIESPDPEKVASAVVRAMDDASIPIESVDAWIGDRAAIADRGLVRRDNVSFLNAIRYELKKSGRKPTRAMIDIITPRKRAGSSWHLMILIRSMLAAGYLSILRRCTEIVSDITLWDRKKNSPHKDGLDALGYAVWRASQKYDLWTDPDE
jgi:hypothetical protein